MQNEQTGAVVAASIWEIDPAHTLVEFSTKHMMITTVKGRFRDVSGILVLDEGDPRFSSAHAEIRTASIDTGVDARDEHLRSDDFLAVERYPLMVFESRKIDGSFGESGQRFRLIGDLTIREATREVILEVTYDGRAPDPWGGERIGFSATTAFDRRDFGLTFNQTLETGGVLVGNEIRVAVQLQAVRK